MTTIRNILCLAALLCTINLMAGDGDSKFSRLVWSDEFDIDGQPDSTKWSFAIGDGCPRNCGWGNNELEYYTNSSKNAIVQDGRLIIQLHKENYEGKDYTSAKLVTKGKADWTYGRFEIRAKLPAGKGTWPAIWMMPSESKYGGWPKSGELDIIEKVGYAPDTVVSATHTGAFNGANGLNKRSDFFLPDNDEVFHTYVLEWGENGYSVFADEVKFHTYSKTTEDTNVWPFNQAFHLILNIAYGGNWGGLMGLDDNALPTQMEIDYVRVYQ